MIVGCVFFILMVIFIFFLVNSQLTYTDSGEEVVCSVDVYNCDDFSTCDEARETFDLCLENVGEDIHGLDLDGDGIPCNSLCS